jgi:hypothetical protein
MIIDLNGEQYTMRATMLAIQEAEQKENIKLHQIDGLVDTAKILYYFAKHGAKANNEKFMLSMASWLDGIALDQVHYLTTVLNALIGGGDSSEAEGKKKGEP